MVLVAAAIASHASGWLPAPGASLARTVRSCGHGDCSRGHSQFTEETEDIRRHEDGGELLPERDSGRGEPEEEEGGDGDGDTSRDFATDVAEKSGAPQDKGEGALIPHTPYELHLTLQTPVLKEDEVKDLGAAEDGDKDGDGQDPGLRLRTWNGYDLEQCSLPGGDCSKTKCCSYFGMYCYVKDQSYATCKDFCIPGIDLADDIKYRTEWDCKCLNSDQWMGNVSGELSDGSKWLEPEDEGDDDGPADGDEEPASPSACSKAGKDCGETECCAEPGLRCYQKNKDFATCRVSCTVGIDLDEDSEFQTPWTCKWLDGQHRKKKDTLFCFCLILPRGYESRLLSLQHAWRTSIFGCDDHAVYSNESVEVSHGIRTVAINSTLIAPKGGEFKTALNLGIFIQIWHHVIKEGRFKRYDWTVKVDADAVFFPDRLRTALWRHTPDADRGVYLSNCKFGLHGPIEVFSTKAVQVWGAGHERCQAHFKRLCSGDCKWGEDMFIDQCFQRVLDVRRDDDYKLLIEDHCDPPDGWRDCNFSDVITLHPFKLVTEYRACFLRAQGKTGPQFLS